MCDVPRSRTYGVEHTKESRTYGVEHTKEYRSARTHTHSPINIPAHTHPHPHHALHTQTHTHTRTCTHTNLRTNPHPRTDAPTHPPKNTNTYTLTLTHLQSGTNQGRSDPEYSIYYRYSTEYSFLLLDIEILYVVRRKNILYITDIQFSVYLRHLSLELGIAFGLLLRDLVVGLVTCLLDARSLLCFRRFSASESASPYTPPACVNMCISRANALSHPHPSPSTSPSPSPSPSGIPAGTGDQTMDAE